MVMFIFWVITKNIVTPIPDPDNAPVDISNESTPLIPIPPGAPSHTWVFDIVDIQSINLYSDEYPDDPAEGVEDEGKGTKFQLFWKLYNMLA